VRQALSLGISSGDYGFGVVILFRAESGFQPGGLMSRNLGFGVIYRF